MLELGEKIGENIRAQRKKQGVSQEMLANRAKIDRSYMSRIERGIVNITVEKLYIIAEVLECDPQTLLPKAHES